MLRPRRRCAAPQTGRHECLRRSHISLSLDRAVPASYAGGNSLLVGIGTDPGEDASYRQGGRAKRSSATRCCSPAAAGEAELTRGEGGMIRSLHARTRVGPLRP
jgi:hypothetical protein